jgi:hypothetical protein
MIMTEYTFGNIKVKVIDKSNHEQRQKVLQEPLDRFYKSIQKGKKDKYGRQSEGQTERQKY